MCTALLWVVARPGMASSSRSRHKKATRDTGCTAVITELVQGRRFIMAHPTQHRGWIRWGELEDGNRVDGRRDSHHYRLAHSGGPNLHCTARLQWHAGRRDAHWRTDHGVRSEGWKREGNAFSMK